LSQPLHLSPQFSFHATFFLTTLKCRAIDIYFEFNLKIKLSLVIKINWNYQTKISLLISRLNLGAIFSWASVGKQAVASDFEKSHL
jgi:hypothetical protein